jgi:hypothetical protein
MADTPYQQQAQIDQAQAELENAKALGLTDRVAAAEKVLDSLGAKSAAKKAAAEERKASAEKSDDEDEPKKAAPEGRSAPPHETTAEPEKRGPGRPRKN